MSVQNVHSDAVRSDPDYRDISAGSGALDSGVDTLHLLEPGHSDGPDYQQSSGEVLFTRYKETQDPQDLGAALEAYQGTVDITPNDDSQKLNILRGLTTCLQARYQHLADLKDLQAGIQKSQEVLTLTPAGHPYRAESVEMLAIFSRARYQRLGDLEDLETALQNFQEAADLTPTGHHIKARRIWNRACCYVDKYQQLGDLKNLDSALQKFQEGMEHASEGHPDLGQVMVNLGDCFRLRYQWGGDSDINDLEAALQKYQEAVKLITEADSDLLPQLMWDIAWCLEYQYHLQGDINDLQSALEGYQKALDRTPEGHPNTAGLLRSLGICFRERYQCQGNLEDLEAALHKFQDSKKLIPEGHPDAVDLMWNLSLCFGSRYQRLGDLQDLEVALQKAQEAVNLTPEEHCNRPKFLETLAITFQARHQRLGDLNDLEAALENSQQAQALTSEWNPDLARLIQDLELAYTNRYWQQGNPHDLQAALQKFQEQVERNPDEEPDTEGIIKDLLTSFGPRYREVSDLKDLDATLQKHQQEVELAPKGHPERPRLIQDLASYFRDRYSRLGNHKDLEAALQRYQEAAELTPEGSPHLPQIIRDLARCFEDRYHRLDDNQDLEYSLQKLQYALTLTPEGHPDKTVLHQAIAMSLTHRYHKFRDPNDLQAVHSHYSESFNSSPATPESSWRAALHWASFAEKSEPSYCLSAYSAAFKLLPDILWIGHSVLVRRAALRRITIGPSTSMALRSCISLFKLTAAVELMEQGIATIFQQTLQLKTDVDKLPAAQAANFRRLSSKLYRGTLTDPIEVMNIVNQRNELLAEIRQQPSLTSFLLPAPYTALRQASQGGPVVILNSHKNACDALIILNPTSEPVHVPLPLVKFDLLESHQASLRDLLRRCNVRTRELSASTRLFGRQERFNFKTTEQSFADLLSWLWTCVAAPIYQVLESNGIYSGRMWWLPTGGFNRLPLHACPPNDQFIHSYTPTLGSLLHAYERGPSGTEPKVGVVGVTHTGSRHLNYLQGVQLEVEKMVSIINQPQVLQGQGATPDAVKQQLQDCSWVHLACHGKQDLIDPTQSHLLLYGGILELETILRMPLPNAEFVFLAACQTAMGDSELVNESFHLGGGFIAAGFRGAVGTLWSMSDQDGPLVAEIVYSHLFRNGRRPQASDAAEALHMAVRELKKQKVPFERWIPFIHMGV
ncbi:CHAT domain-containing protein [Mycena vulgaris]|nr:CHAT domain-containing protein [Mycena vulgaris]